MFVIAGVTVRSVFFFTFSFAALGIRHSRNIKKTAYQLSKLGFRLSKTVPAEISCSHDFVQKLALSLLYCLKIGRNHRQK